MEKMPLHKNAPLIPQRRTMEMDIASIADPASRPMSKSVSNVNAENVYGFTREQLAALRQPQPARDPWDWDAPLPPILDAQTLLDQLTAAKAVFQERAVYQLAATLALHSGDSVATAEQIARQAIDSVEAIDLGSDYRHCRLLTTSRQLVAEQTLVADAKALAAQRGFEVPGSALEQALSNQHIALSDEQAEAVRTVCQAALRHFAGQWRRR